MRINKKAYFLSLVVFKLHTISSTKIITNAKKHKMLVLSYNRKNESKSSKLKENSSISWGISSCLKSDSPDIIYHKGDFGKEPMIIVFGATPTEVVKKIKMIQ